MDHCVCKQLQPVARKANNNNKKKTHGKDEFDRVKQAEKKKRRLEKALATSAAIRAELEKKKQKKLEEQQRLDREGAAIAEAVALHVLLGEDSDDDYDSSRVMLGEDERVSKRWIGLEVKEEPATFHTIAALVAMRLGLCQTVMN